MDINTLGAVFLAWSVWTVKAVAVVGGIAWTAIQIHDRLVTRVRVKVHPGILFRKPQRFEDALQRIFTEGGDPTKVFVAPRNPETAFASAQATRDVPRGALDERPAMFVRVYNHSPKRKITVVRVWCEGPGNQQVPMDGPNGPLEIAPESYSETWVLIENIPAGLTKPQRYGSFRALIQGRNRPESSVMADHNEVGARGDLATHPTAPSEW